MKHFLCIFLFIYTTPTYAQTNIPDKTLVKLRHAEPLYIDLIRDLGARKGEKEWNIGGGTERQKNYTVHSGFVEYEFSPLNRLGMEIEIPFSFYRMDPATHKPFAELKNRIEAVKLATQYTFLVSQRSGISAAVAYIHEFRIHSFRSIHESSAFLKGHGYNPVLIIAKHWGQHLHSLVYTGPRWETTFGTHVPAFTYQLNTSLHYLLPNQNFIGMEMNQEIHSGHVITTLRPQMKMILSSSLALGLVSSIPLQTTDNGLGIFFRLIYEPSGKK